VADVMERDDEQLTDDIQGFLRERTHLLQIYTSDPEEGPRMISENQADGQGIPLMVLVDGPSCCYFKLNIPNGMLILE